MGNVLYKLRMKAWVTRGTVGSGSGCQSGVRGTSDGGWKRPVPVPIFHSSRVLLGPPPSSHTRRRFRLTSTSLGLRAWSPGPPVGQGSGWRTQSRFFTHPEVVPWWRRGASLLHGAAGWKFPSRLFCNSASPRLQPECLHLWCHVQYVYIRFRRHLYNGWFFFFFFLYWLCN